MSPSILILSLALLLSSKPSSLARHFVPVPVSRFPRTVFLREFCEGTSVEREECWASFRDHGGVWAADIDGDHLDYLIVEPSGGWAGSSGPWYFLYRRQGHDWISAEREDPKDKNDEVGCAFRWIVCSVKPDGGALQEPAVSGGPRETSISESVQLVTVASLPAELSVSASLHEVLGERSVEEVCEHVVPAATLKSELSAPFNRGDPNSISTEPCVPGHRVRDVNGLRLPRRGEIHNALGDVQVEQIIPIKNVDAIGGVERQPGGVGQSRLHRSSLGIRMRHYSRMGIGTGVVVVHEEGFSRILLQLDLVPLLAHM